MKTYVVAIISVLMGLVTLSCHKNEAVAQSTKSDFESVYNKVKIRWETAFDDLNQQYEACDMIAEKNDIVVPSRDVIVAQGLTQRQFRVSLFLWSQDLKQECIKQARNNAAYELGVYNHFIRENREEMQANNLMPNEEFYTWNDYTGNSEIIFEEDLLIKQSLRDEIGPLTDTQEKFIRNLVNGKPFNPLLFFEDTP